MSEQFPANPSEYEPEPFPDTNRIPRYKPEKDIREFTLGDFALNLHRQIKRTAAADSLAAAHLELKHVGNGLDYLLTHLAERYPEIETEIFEAMKTEPEPRDIGGGFDYTDVDYLAGMKEEKLIPYLVELEGDQDDDERQSPPSSQPPVNPPLGPDGNPT